MAKPDWGALQHQFLAEHAKTGISPKDWCEAQGLKYATAKRHIKVTSYGANSQKENANKTANAQKRNSSSDKAGSKVSTKREIAKPVNSPDAKPDKPKRKVVTNHPPFQKGNQHALKHGGYGRRMLLTDAITEDAQALALDDELFWLRAANLTAAENIGRWQSEMEPVSDEEKKDFHDLISSAQKAMHRNTARIESLEYTKASIDKLRADTEYRSVATEKVELEIGLIKDGGSDNAIVVHNTLPIPGR